MTSYTVKPYNFASKIIQRPFVSSTISEVYNYLYLCSYNCVTTETIHRKKINFVINVCNSLQKLFNQDINYHFIKMEDVPSFKIYIYFNKVADIIHIAHLNGERVLIHCVSGVSRSATLVLAYMMKYKKKTLIEAYRYLKSVRPVIRPNIGFFAQLINYERSLYGFSTVSMVRTSKGYLPSLYLSR